MSSPLDSIPFYGAYRAASRENQAAGAQDVQTALHAQGLLENMRKMQEDNQIKAILKDESIKSFTEAEPKLRALGPRGIEIADKLMQLDKHKTEAAQGQREAAVFSPQNIAANTIPGQSAQPAIPQGLDELGGGPGRPAQVAVAPQINMDALRQQAATTGPKGLEAYSQHTAAEGQRRATLDATKAQREQTLAVQMAGLQEKAREADQKSKDTNASVEQRREAAEESRQLRREMMAAASAMRQPPQPRNLQLTTDAQGNQLIVHADGTTSPLTAADGTGVKKAVAADKPMTEFQGKAALYGTRSAQSDKVLKSIEDKISTTGLAMGQATGVVGNALMSSDQRRVDQAQRDFVNAVLRQESGAVISDAEFANAKKQYFPQPGDDPKVVAQKRANRQLAIKGFARMSGPKGSADIQAIIDEPLLPGVAAISPTPAQSGVGGSVTDQADAILNRKR